MKKDEHINCLIVDDEAVARDIIATHLNKIDTINILGNCKSAVDALSIINNSRVDLLFLDINMPEISGISFASTLPKHIKVIFTTAYRDYAVEGFELRAVDYLLKPISFERILKSISAYIESQNYRQEEKVNLESTDFLFVRSDRKMVKINFDEIIYVESYSDYLKIHLDDQTVITRETISSIEGKLPKDNFIRIHRSFIISIAKINSFTNEEVTIDNKSLPISRSYKKSVLYRLESF